MTLALEALVLSPLFGLMGGFVLMVLLLWLVRPLRPTTVNRTFRVLQLVSAGFMAFAHGSNDAQKSMGIITMALAAYAGQPGTSARPSWTCRLGDRRLRHGDGAWARRRAAGGS